MPPTPRRTRQKQDLRQQILDATRDIFVAEGYDDLSMRKVAARIGCSPTAIYLHFKDKAALVQALCDEIFLGLNKRLEALAKTHTDPLEYLDAGLRIYIDHGLKHPSHYHVVFVAGPRSVDYEYEGSTGERAFQFLSGCVERCMQAGRIRQGDVEVTAQTLWMAVHGLVALLISDKSFPFAARKKLIDQLMKTLIAGLRDTSNVDLRTSGLE
jgi:AcrR family transcriptional regulator